MCRFLPGTGWLENHWTYGKLITAVSRIDNKPITETRSWCLPLSSSSAATAFHAFSLILLFLNSLSLVLNNTGLLHTLSIKLLSKARQTGVDAILSALHHHRVVYLRGLYIGLKSPQRWLVVGYGSYPVSEMTYTVSGGTLNPTQPNPMRIGKRFHVQCAPLVPAGSHLKFVNMPTVKYLGVYLVAANKWRLSIDHLKIRFYRVFNYIYAQCHSSKFRTG